LGCDSLAKDIVEFDDAIFDRAVEPSQEIRRTKAICIAKFGALKTFDGLVPFDKDSSTRAVRLALR
jgi:hypothetical protein